MIPLPNLVGLQIESFNRFLHEGLAEVLKEFSPIEDFVGKNLELHFSKHVVEEAKFSERQARERSLTYEAPLRIKSALIFKKTNRKIEQDIYFGTIPLMTDRGTFIINGVERIIMQQLVRSPGVYFSSEFYHGMSYYGAKVIPDRGSWLEFETDQQGIMWVRIDQQRKMAATSLLRAFGYGSDAEIVDLFKSVDTDPEVRFIERTLEKDPASNEEEGLIEVYHKIRPGELATVENARSLIHTMFFNEKRYDLATVGRYKLNQRLGLHYKNSDDNTKRILQPNDIVGVIKEIIRLNSAQEEEDDIDRLDNRRIRGVGELIQGRMRLGFMRLSKIIRDRMSSIDPDTLTPAQLVNAKVVMSSIKDFFMTSQLSQFMDQINCVAELEHKRKFTAAGPGGLSKERAGIEIRDVHKTFYGKICPIATPEGPNVGIVGHLATHAQLNEHGFLVTPYRRVKGGKLTNEIVHLSSFEEQEHTITSITSVSVDKNGMITDERIEARVKGEMGFCSPTDLDFIDVSPYQIVSLATALIPFLEHDDGVRALMGSNMQRQAVPLIHPEAPFIGTGLEGKIAYDSGYVCAAKEDGVVTKVNGGFIEIKSKNKKTDTYDLVKFHRSNADTCLNQRVIANIGDAVKKGDVLVDGPSMDHGEIALGRNILVAFLSWEGWNFEDAIIVSSRLVKEDVFTSVHINEYIIDVRETKLGPEIVTRDIPNVSEEKLKNLDEEGVIRIGAEVKSGDILVGKISPKGETELSAEEKLLRAIFGEKAKDVRDTSLYLEHGEKGKVINIHTFSRDAGDKLEPGVIKRIQVLVADMRKVQVGDKIAGRHGNKGVVSIIVPEEDMPYLEDGTPIDILLNPLGVVSRMNIGQILETHLGICAKKLGYRIATQPFRGITEEFIEGELKKIGFPENGKVLLYDGRTGASFTEQVTVGVMYIMKLNHLVEDKIHQRSIGPYSLITQQPLGGKAQFGGQRFGEMEVWALEGYGAAYMLQEMLTIKSDDVPGRTRAYEAIIKGAPIQEINLPESFNVLVRELKGLCLNVELLSGNEPRFQPKPRKLIKKKK
ncbi:MAG: DNA-directed RNA polymerase subunit beta [Parcubacteria group bacterium]|nr:DNA-directed RNA polymerase subunit beta [Parcubacteria group bacterium]